MRHRAEPSWAARIERNHHQGCRHGVVAAIHKQIAQGRCHCARKLIARAGTALGCKRWRKHRRFQRHGLTQRALPQRRGRAVAQRLRARKVVTVLSLYKM